MSAFVPKWTPGDWFAAPEHGAVGWTFETSNGVWGGVVADRVAPEDTALMACSKRLAERLLERVINTHQNRHGGVERVGPFAECVLCEEDWSEDIDLLRECGAIP